MNAVRLRASMAELPRAESRKAPLVSVVITAYNHAGYIPEAVSSVSGQTEGDHEIILVDDGSTDDTPECAKGLAGVRYFRQSNRGLSAARNAGLRESRGKYIVFLDADDRLLPGAVEAGLRCFDLHPSAALVAGRHRRVSDDGTLLGISEQRHIRGSFYEAFLRGNVVGMHAAVMYRRDRLLELGGFDESLPACEDYDAYLRAARLYPIATHADVVADYRIHERNMSLNVALMLSAALRVLRSQKEYTLSDPRRSAAYKQGLRSWRQFYGSKIIPRLKALARDEATLPHRVSAVRDLVRADPATFLVHTVRGAGRRFRRRLRRRFRHRVGNGRSGGRWAKGRRLIPMLGRTRAAAPPPGAVRFGDFRRLVPLSRHFGFDRGCPIDRYYIEAFLARNAAAIRGRVLEIGDDVYTKRFGGDAVRRSDVLHVDPGHSKATFIDDLACGESLPSDTFDCIILTQTLHLIYDLKAALRTLDRILTKGGVLLMTVPGTISQLEQGVWRDAWHWGFTELSLGKLCEESFEAKQLEMVTYGNVLTSVAFLQGMAASELKPEELEHFDPLYPLLITVRLKKADLPCGASGASR